MGAKDSNQGDQSSPEGIEPDWQTNKNVYN